MKTKTAYATTGPPSSRAAAEAVHTGAVWARARGMGVALPSPMRTKTAYAIIGPRSFKVKAEAVATGAEWVKDRVMDVATGMDPAWAKAHETDVAVATVTAQAPKRDKAGSEISLLAVAAVWGTARVTDAARATGMVPGAAWATARVTDAAEAMVRAWATVPVMDVAEAPARVAAEANVGDKPGPRPVTL